MFFFLGLRLVCDGLRLFDFGQRIFGAPTRDQDLQTRLDPRNADGENQRAHQKSHLSRTENFVRHAKRLRRITVGQTRRRVECQTEAITCCLNRTKKIFVF